MESMNLIMSANADLLSFSVSYYYGIIQRAGAIWLAPHSIEKYLKAILVHFEPDSDLKSLGHDLYGLEKRVLSVRTMPKYIGVIISEIDGIDTDFRYGVGPEYEFPDDFFFKLWVAGRWLRLAGNKLYGIENDKMFGVGLAYASRHVRNERHNQLRTLIDEFEEETRMGRDYNMLSGWVDVKDATKESFDYPTSL